MLGKLLLDAADGTRYRIVKIGRLWGYACVLGADHDMQWTQMVKFHLPTLYIHGVFKAQSHAAFTAKDVAQYRKAMQKVEK